MKRLSQFVFVLLVLAISVPTLAATISGVVVDSRTGEPLIGANVVIKGTRIGSATDLNGEFKFEYEVTGEFWLTVKYVGYKGIEQQYSSGQDMSGLNFKLEEDVFKSEEVVVTGIASKTSKAVAEVAVASVAAENLTEETAYQDMSQMVAGKVSGVNVRSTSGNVGGGFRFNVRSAAGMNGDEQPVIYIDGVRVDNAQIRGFGTGGQGNSLLADLNPEEVEKIEVLKGPAGAASYGTDGSNGVILIQTKRGKMKKGTGKPKPYTIHYKYVGGYNTQSYEYDNKTDNITTADSANATFRNGPIEQHTLGIAGGSELLRYYVGFDRRFEQGIQTRNDMDRRNYRLNLDAFPSQNLTIRASLSYARNEIGRPHNDNNIFGWLGNVFLTHPVTRQTYFFTGHKSIEDLRNEDKSNRFIGALNFEFIPMDNLEFRATVGMDEGDLKSVQHYPADRPYMFYPAGDKGIWTRNHTNTNFEFNGRYSYKIVPELSATTIAGLQLFDRRVTTFFLERSNFLTGLIKDIGAGSQYEQGGESFLHRRQAGIFFDQSFSYKNQYFFTLGLRNDYASTIGEDAPNIIYPKASLAIRLDKYDFFPGLFDLMKIRTAYGETGQLPAETDGIPLLWQADNYGPGVGANLNGIGNTEIEPERIKEIEFGFDAQFLNNYSVEFTYYINKAENSIINKWNPPSTGKTITAVPFNLGESKGWGLESLLSASFFRTKNTQLDLTLINNYATNEVVDMGGAAPIINVDNVIKEGYKKHDFMVYKVLGAQFDENGEYAGVWTDEDTSYVDPYTGKVGSGDTTVVGSPIPPYTGSFSMNLRFLKNFNLYMLCDWATNFKVLNQTKQFVRQFNNDPEYTKQGALIGLVNLPGEPVRDDYDTQDDYDAAMEGYNNYYETFPELVGVTAYEVGTPEYISAAHKYAKMRHTTECDWNFFDDGDFFKVREVSLRYSFKDLLPRMGIDNVVTDLSLGFSGRNLLTLTKYDGPEPEVSYNGARSGVRGTDFLTMQFPRVYTFILQITF